MSAAAYGIIGVLAGVLLTGLINFFLQRAADRRRWQRDDEAQQKRWEHEDEAHHRQWEREQEAQRERWRREDLVRHHSERFQLYSEFNQAASAIVEDAFADVLDTAPVYAEEESKELHRKVVAELYPRVEVIASEPAKEAAQEFVQNIWRAALNANDWDYGDPQIYAQALSKCSRKFAEAAREELGVALDQKDASAR